MIDMHIDFEKTLAYYKSGEVQACTCKVCQNFCRKIKALRPDLSEYLSSLGVDICKPFELIWLENEDSNIRHIGCQYVVFGTCEEDFSKEINGITFLNNIAIHPPTGLTEPHFILDFGELTIHFGKD